MALFFSYLPPHSSPHFPISSFCFATGFGDLLTTRDFSLRNTSQLGLQLPALWGHIQPAAFRRSGNCSFCGHTCNRNFSVVYMHLFSFIIALSLTMSWEVLGSGCLSWGWQDNRSVRADGLQAICTWCRQGVGAMNQETFLLPGIRASEFPLLVPMSSIRLCAGTGTDKLQVTYSR